MKKLALLMLAILILGCGTETTVVEEPKPVIEEPSLIVTSGEHFRIDISEPQIVSGPAIGGGIDVDPQPLNVAGFFFVFDEDLKLYRADLRLKDGESLGWLPQGIVDRQNIGPFVRLQPFAGAPLLEFDTEYEINIFAQDLACYTSEHVIPFRTMPEP